MITLLWKSEEREVKVSKHAKTESLVKEACEITKVKSNRIRLYYKIENQRLLLEPDQLISSVKATTFEVVDSGPQFSTTVDNLCEYIPPILIWLGAIFIMKPLNTEYIQIASVMWGLHFIRGYICAHIFT